MTRVLATLLLATLFLATPLGVGGLSGGGVLFAEGEGEEENAASRPTAPKIDPQLAKGYFDQADVAREEERWKEAADLYWKAVEADATHYDAHVRYQEMQLRAGGKPAFLVGDYDSFVADYPQDVRFRLHRLRLDPVADRVPALEALLKTTPKEGHVLLEYGRALLQANDASRAAKALGQSLAALGTGRTDVLLLAAEAEFRAGQAAAARLRLDKAVSADNELFVAHLLLARFDLLEGSWPDASRRADLCLQLRPTWVAAALVKSEALARQNQKDAAVATLETLRAKGRETPALLVALGDLIAKDGKEADLTAATAIYEKVLAADAANARALYGLGWVLERQGKFSDAEARYRASAQGMPTDPAPVNSVGYCLLKLGKIEDAKIQFRKAVDLDASYVPALANLGAAHDAQANYAEALKVYDRILKMKGQESNLRVVVNAAFDHEALGSFTKAEDLLKRARKVAPEDAQLATWLGDNLYFQEKYKDAERAYQDAIALDPKSFYAHRGYGYTLGAQRKWADAVAELEKAREIKPTDQDVLMALGDIYWDEVGDLEKALKAYEAYIQAGGTDPDVPEYINEIRKALEGK